MGREPMTRNNGSDVYRRLGKKIDSLTVRAPWNETFLEILKKLYTSEEAELLIKMPYTLSTSGRIAAVAGVDKTRTSALLDSLCGKGLVLDLFNENDGQYYYMPSPVLIGLFEFTMMRGGEGHDKRGYAHLFREYFHEFYPANYSKGEQVGILRVIPVEETIRTDECTEFMDYEKASMLVENSNRFALGLCSCRNEKHLNGEKKCDTPMNNCSMLGVGADYTIRHNMAREVSRSEMLENLARSKELGLVLCAENTRRNPMVICNCCKCCCNYLAGLNTFGFTNSAVTSNFISSIDASLCKGCGKCAEPCPVDAVDLVSAHDPKRPGKKTAEVDPARCVGCGVCALKCKAGAVAMIKRKSRVIHPETTFERIMLLSLERGTLQNQVFDNPESMTHEIMRVFIGAFLKIPPVKKALMSDMFRSRFLASAKKIATLQGKGWMLDI
jgi:NAD-dependent dihydropyrimidine dehydrogenase PreA subunit